MNTARHILLTFARQSIAIALRLGFMVIVARLLGPARNGQYAMAMLVPMLLTGLLNLGIPGANSYYIARGSLPLKAALKLNARLYAGLVLVGAFVASMVACFAASLIPGVPTHLVLLGWLLFPISLAAALLAGLLQAVRDFDAFNRALLLVPVLSLVLLSCICLQLGSSTRVAHVVIVQLLSEAAGLAYLAVSLRLHIRSAATDAPNAGIAEKQLLSFGGVIHIGNVLMQLNYRTDLYLVNTFLGPAASGVYYIAVRVAEQVWIASQSMTTVLMPVLSARKRGEFEPDDMVPYSIRMSFYAGIALGLGLVFVVRPALARLFGHAYQDAADLMMLLLPGALLLNGARVACVAMTALGKPQFNLVVAVAVFLVNVILNLLLIPRLGTNGAALATSASYCAGSLIALSLLSRIANKSLLQLLTPTRHDGEVLLKLFMPRPRGSGLR
jgi:O-antigen/teichoic acid export membrane protein